jgi:hypothetical protein
MNDLKATVCIDADELRTIWYVLVDNLEGKTICRWPFRLREEAQKYADRINNQHCWI